LFYKIKISARQDAEPGFVEHGSESKPDPQKTRKLTAYTSIGGQFSLVTFFVCTKKVTRPVGEKTRYKKQIPDSAGMTKT